ncbi:MAG: family 78 glycoside hydrolase catalytic domain, partial [Opitutaceae bacterium]|nr:family 78 glycoside hydrolase catalytic domain [Opitutaceae bacterium]
MKTTRRRILSLVLATAALLPAAVPAAAPRPEGLRCEHTVNPLGIDAAAPRFSWRVDTLENGAAQSAYRVLVASSVEKLARGEGDVWDSGRVASRRSAGVAFGGAPLESRARYHWKVRVWDEKGAALEDSGPAWFEMGLLRDEDWEARWIGAPLGREEAAKYFRCVFQVSAPVRRARLYITGLGCHEAFINGARLGDAVLDPALTDTARRVLYRTHDVTALLRDGRNAIGVACAPGWHGRPVLLAQLEITLENGERQLVLSRRDYNWRSADGPVRRADIYDGEHYDARREFNDWNQPGYSTRGAPGGREGRWRQVFAERGPAGKLRAQPLEPVRVIRELPAQTVTEPVPGVFVFDFGRNHAGWPRLRAQGEGGTKIIIKYAESLLPDGTVNQENLRGALATDSYILRGGGAPEEWEPRFTCHGYRYAQVEGWPGGAPAKDALVSRVVRSDLAARGEFSCDLPLLNKIHEMVRWTEESNLHGIPTDCPQRDERQGWLNDLAARAEELVYNFDAARFLEKFTADISDTQDPRTGAIADTAPFHWGNQPADPVSVCYLLIPWLVWQHHATPAALADNYGGLRAWVDFLGTRAAGRIVDYSYYGDWAPPESEASAGSMGLGALSAKTPGALISTAYYYYAASLLSKTAAVLGRDDDYKNYNTLAAEIKTAFHNKFWDEKAGGYGPSNQACNAIALYLGLVPGTLRPRVLGALVLDVEAHDFHLTTGNLCTKYLLEV